MAMYDPEYLRLARQLCDRHEVHLICDEIAVGCGRTGTFFAHEQAEIRPDLMCLSKGISGGYLPLSIVLCSDTIYAAFLDDSVARAFLKNAPIVVLDEQTYQIDVETETLLNRALARLPASKTVLLIAHRLSTIERADRIVAVEEGRIVEQGTHAELLTRGGLYARLHALQFRS